MVKSINLLHSKDGYPNNYQNRRNPRRSRTGHWCFWRPPFPDANFTQWNWRVFCVWSEPFNVSTLSDTAQSRLFFWNVCPAVYSFRQMTSASPPGGTRSNNNKSHNRYNWLEHFQGNNYMKCSKKWSTRPRSHFNWCSNEMNEIEDSLCVWRGNRINNNWSVHSNYQVTN